MRSNLGVMTYVTEIVDLCPTHDARGSEARAINGGAGADLHIVLDDHVPNMRKMLE